MFKKIILKILINSGYFVQKKTHMSYGVEHAIDILRFSNGIQKINTIFDVGANIGQTASYYSGYFPDAKIYSFEPVSDSYNQLCENIIGYSNCSAYKLALGSKQETLEIELQEKSVYNSLLRSKSIESNFKETVKVCTLDSFIENNQIKAIDILKIDTEGYEIDVLNGGELFLKNAKKCFLFIESTFIKEKKYQTQFSDIFEQVYPLGFRFIGIYDHAFSQSDPMRPPLQHCNALFYKSE